MRWLSPPPHPTRNNESQVTIEIHRYSMHVHGSSIGMHGWISIDNPWIFVSYHRTNVKADREVLGGVGEGLALSHTGLLPVLFRSHIDLTSIARRFHIDYNSISHRFHFGSTSISRFHCDITSISLRSRIDFISA